MFDYYYATTSGDPDWPAPLVVRLNSLSPATLRSLRGYLIDSLPLRYDLQGVNTHLGARPLSFEVGGEALFTERAIWALLIEMPNGADYAVEYVDAVIEGSGSNDDLALYSCLDVVGQDPLYAYIDRHIRRERLDSPRNLEPYFKVTDCFLRFLQRCDMDHETFQNDNIGPVLRFLNHRDSARFLDLLAFRLTTGQHDQLSPDQFYLLQGDGVLKRVIDRVSSIVDPGWGVRIDILQLCYAVYGSNMELTNDVLAYYRDRVDLGEDHDLKNFQRDLQLIQEQRDSIWKRRQRNLNTGFHRYDKNTQEWSKVT